MRAVSFYHLQVYVGNLRNIGFKLSNAPSSLSQKGKLDEYDNNNQLFKIFFGPLAYDTSKFLLHMSVCSEPEENQVQTF